MHDRVRATHSEAIVHGPPICRGHLRASNWAALGRNNPNERYETLKALRPTACTKRNLLILATASNLRILQSRSRGERHRREHLEDRTLRAADSWPRRGPACHSGTPVKKSVYRSWQCHGALCFIFLVRSPIWLFESAKQTDREWKSK
jgi:hypothetical protein